MSFYEKSKELRERGKLGLNKGIPFLEGFERFSQYVPNLQPKYYISAADSGVGKTKLGHLLFLFTPIIQFIEGKINDVEIHYYTSEMTIEEIIGEFQAFWINRKYKVLTDLDQMYSLGDNKITKRVDELLSSEEIKNITDIFEEKVHITTERITPKFMYKEIYRISNDNGTIEYKDSESKIFNGYKKNNQDKWIIILYDNFQKTKTHAGQNKREAIEEMSGYFDMARQKFGFIVAAMQQINRTSKSFDRYKLEQFFPSEQDLKDSEAPFHDCQVAIVQISPYKLDLAVFEDYDIKKTKDGLRDRLRAIKIIKNRGGKAYLVNMFAFFGEIGLYKELPYAEHMKIADYIKVNNKKKDYEN